MLIEIIRYIVVLAGAVGGVYLGNYIGLPKEFFLPRSYAIILFMLLGALFGYLAGGVAGRRLYRLLLWTERALQNVPLPEFLAGVAGLIVGLILAFLVSLPLGLLPASWGLVRLFVVVFLFVVLGGAGIRLGVRQWQAHGGDQWPSVGTWATTPASDRSAGRLKLVDTNVLIDGRIVDICKTGFLDGELLVPRFVLAELHCIADSENELRRNRGRRGLDVLKALQESGTLPVSFTDKDFPDQPAVDAKLVKLATEMNAAIVTNDYNLNKVASIQGVRILNINDLANAVKSAVLPGEELVTKLHKVGKEPGQGVGYLEDGTMVVVEGGAEMLGKSVISEVTGVLQTPAGRMVFAKLKRDAATA